MAKKKGKKKGNSVLDGALGSKINKALSNHSGDELDSGQGELPGGIGRGVAQLHEAKIGKYENGPFKGKPFFMAMATVKEPTKYTGDFTKVGPEPLCDTPESQGKKKTLDDHIAWVLNIMRVLGQDTSEVETGADLEELIEQANEEKPHFLFRTVSFEDSDNVWHHWRKPLEDYEEEEEDEVEEDEEEEDEVEDEEEDAEEDEDTEDEEDEEEEEDEIEHVTGKKLKALAKKADAENKAAQKQLTALAEHFEIDVEDEQYEDWAAVAAAYEEALEGQDEDEEEDDEEEEEGNYVSWQDRGALADDGDQDEEKELKKGAKKHGIDPDDHETWVEVGEAIAAAEAEEEGEEDEEEEEDEDEDWEPQVGEDYDYKPPKKKKAISIEIKTVNKKAKTVTGEDGDGKKYAKVPWDKLEVE